MLDNDFNQIKPIKCLFDPLFGMKSRLEYYYHCDQIYELIFRYRNTPEIADQMMGIYNDLGYKSFDPFRMVNMPLLSRFHDASHIFLNVLVENLASMLDFGTEVVCARLMKEDERIKIMDQKKSATLSGNKVVNIQDVDLKIDLSNIVIMDGVNYFYKRLDYEQLSSLTIYIDEERQFNQWCFLPGRIRRPKYMYAIYFSSDLKNKIIQHIEQNFAQLAKAIKKPEVIEYPRKFFLPSNQKIINQINNCICKFNNFIPIYGN